MEKEVTFQDKMRTFKTYEDWGYSKVPHNLSRPEQTMNVYCAEAIADYADYEERVIVRSYPWLVRPVVRWLRRATRR